MIRRTLSAALLVVACLLVPLGTLSTWAKYEIGDSDRYVATMEPLATDPSVQNVVADAVTDGVMKQLDFGPLHDAVSNYLHDAVVSFTGTATFQRAWDTANRSAHDAVQTALDNGSTGDVTLDLAPVTEQVKKQLEDGGVPFASQIPVTHTQITVLSAGSLKTLRLSLHALQLAGPWLPLAALVCAVAGLLLAVRRRRALAVTALGAALAAGALLIALPIARSLTLGDLPDATDRAAAGAVYDALTSSMRTASWVIVGVGLVVAAVAWSTERNGGWGGRRNSEGNGGRNGGRSGGRWASGRWASGRRGGAGPAHPAPPSHPPRPPYPPAPPTDPANRLTLRAM
ncbi:hypothetical protein [Streptomyces beihaiensis]|uniref:Integral membrane protein n=1 Tax=Streptomyces beihaiensis TaxID=2984495 RepID=A0ABT3U0U9_9ACTN|nr:hypothetical protein [Streptomyces beihaiensis]MCX3062326.1 hypothetical protein [Streptomyces beihaiensis]